MINFVVVSADLRPHVLDTRVKRAAEPPIDQLDQRVGSGGGDDARQTQQAQA